MECSSSGLLLPRLGCILSYDGDLLDVAINYALLGLACLTWLQFVKDEESTVEQLGRMQHLACFLFFTVYQIVLCLILGCAGISIIWNACAGFLLTASFLRSQRGFKLKPWPFVLAGVCLLADVYYFVTSELLTTIAHVAAVLMGAVVRLVCSLCQQSSSQNDPHSGSLRHDRD
mmetsp:Transcript_59674/g.141986  ORF Transcript_59674/g.141986 Transcript_59674/m.141986 type:complete len:174 (+) Transcript_59674:125-646(+)